MIRLLKKVYSFYWRKKIDFEGWQMKRRVIMANKNSHDEEIEKIIGYLKSHKLTYFNYSWYEPDESGVELFYDEDYKGYYAIYFGYKMYLKKGWSDERCRTYLGSLYEEQKPQSPHRYLDDEMNEIPVFHCVVDSGGAEGSFSLSILNRSEKIIIFESDEGWIEALSKTFEGYQNVNIVPYFMGDKDDDKVRMLDSVCGEKQVDLVKMDIEGDEIKGLYGGINTLNRSPLCRYLICAYHYQGEENDIKNFFAENIYLEYEIIPRQGYMYFLHDKDQKVPYLRRGVLYCRPSATADKQGIS